MPRSPDAETRRVLEDTRVAAYAGQGPRIKQKALLAAAGSILAVEVRHAAWVRKLIGGEFAATKSEILSAVQSTGFITG